MVSKGYIAVFEEELDKPFIKDIAEVWMDSYSLEQVCPGALAGTMTVPIREAADIVWETNLQFRVTGGETFTWVYLTVGKRVLETSGLPDEANTFPLEVLADLPAIEEVVSQENERRLDQLEAEGLI